jgi:nucleotide-binding universal stress UspA family protein
MWIAKEVEGETMKIILAIDGSAESQQAVQAVAARPWPPSSIARVLSVWQSPYVLATSSEAMSGAALEQVSGELESEARRVVALGLAGLKLSDFALESAVRRGDAKREIVSDAEEWGADLVVLGSHGHAGIGRWLLGSTAEYVVRHAPCSVEVIRTRK